MEAKKGRNKVNCPVGGCKASIVNLKRHLVNVHKWEGEKARTARLNFGLRKDFKAKHIGRRKTKSRIYKRRICPYEMCGRVVKRLDNHLRQFHHVKDFALRKECLTKACYSLEDQKTISDVSEDDDDTSENEKFVRKECFMLKLCKVYQNEDESMENIAERSDNSFSYSEGQDDLDDEEWIMEENERINSNNESSREVKYSYDQASEISEEITNDASSDDDNSVIDNTSFENVLFDWEKWFMSPDGGNKKQRDAQHHTRQVGKVLQHVGGLKNIFDKNILWQSWLQPFDKQRQPGTIKSYLSSLHLFYSYLINENIKVPAAQKEIVRIKETKQWSKNYRKQCIRRFWQKEEEDIDKLATPEEIRKFDSSKPVRKVIKLYSKLSTCSFQVSSSDFTNLRDHLISLLCMQNASRTGAISHIKANDVKRAKKIGDTMSIVVLDHKTLTLGAGPAALNLDCKAYNHLGIFIEKVRPSIESPLAHKPYVFVTHDKGTQLNTSEISEQFNSFWTRAVGTTKYRNRMNATLFRKSCTTKVHSSYPDMKRDLATLMNHKEETATRSYFLQDKIQTAVKTSERLRVIMRENEDSSNTTTIDEAIKLFSDIDIDSINLDIVKDTLMRNNLLGKVDIKQVYSQIKKKIGREQQKQIDSMRDSSNYVEIGGMQQIEEDAVVQEDFDIGVSNAIEEDDPFTEAGSSVYRSRVTYSDGEVSAVLSVFKDLIEGDRDIKKAKVLDRFKSH